MRLWGGGGLQYIGDSHVFTVDIHEFNIILARSFLLRRLEHQIQSIRGIIRLDSNNIIILSGTKDLCERVEVNPESDVAVATIRIETLGAKKHAHEGNVRIVHRLKRDT